MKHKKYQNPVGTGRFTGLLLISPFIAGFLLFTLYPLVQSFITSLEISPGVYNFDSYRNVISDRSVIKAVTVTLKYTAVLVPLKLLVSLLTALLLNMELRGIGVFRTIFYIPSILGSNLAIAIIWQYLFTSDGLVNQLIGLLGLSPVGWYSEAAPAMSIIILLRLWEFGSTMVIFLAALKEIPGTYYDAAKVDGCGKIRAFFSITLPLIKNVIFINLILQTISAVQEFNAPYIITGGAPMKNTYTIGMLIYDYLFKSFEISEGCAVSLLMFLTSALIITIIYAVSGKLRDNP